MSQLSFGSPVLLKKLRKEFGSLPSNRIKMRSSKDVSQFLKKKRDWEELAKKKPLMKFK